jgi:hypothetical protein
LRSDAATYGVGWLNERVVDSDDGDIVVLDTVSGVSWCIHIAIHLLFNSRVAEDNATNAAETVDTDLGGGQRLFVLGICHQLLLRTLTTIFAIMCWMCVL